MPQLFVDHGHVLSPCGESRRPLYCSGALVVLRPATQPCDSEIRYANPPVPDPNLKSDPTARPRAAQRGLRTREHGSSESGRLLAEIGGLGPIRQVRPPIIVAGIAISPIPTVCSVALAADRSSLRPTTKRRNTPRLPILSLGAPPVRMEAGSPHTGRFLGLSLPALGGPCPLAGVTGNLPDPDHSVSTLCPTTWRGPEWLWGGCPSDSCDRIEEADGVAF